MLVVVYCVVCFAPARPCGKSHRAHIMYAPPFSQVGNTDTLDMSQHRWNLPIHLLDCAFFGSHGHASSPDFVVEGQAAEELVAELAAAVQLGEKNCALHSSPHLVLLSTKFYHNTLKPLVVQWLWLWLAKHPQLVEDVGDGLEALRATTIVYLAGALSDATAAFDAMASSLSTLSRQLLVLGRDWVCKYVSCVPLVPDGLFQTKQVTHMRRCGLSLSVICRMCFQRRTV